VREKKENIPEIMGKGGWVKKAEWQEVIILERGGLTAGKVRGNPPRSKETEERGTGTLHVQIIGSGA